jgi:hypothetical protein
LRQAVEPVQPDDPALLEEIKAVRERYAHARRMANAYGAEFLVFWQPLIWTETGKVDPEVKRREEKLLFMKVKFKTFRQTFTTIYRTIAAHLQDEPYFFNFQDVLCSRPERVYDPDGVHLNGIGNHMVAEAMAEKLKERGW